MYCKIAEEEDNRMVERYQSDSVGILIFVSPHVSPSMNPLINRNIEWFILRHRRCIAYDLNPRPQVKLTKHFRILPTEHISSPRQPRRFSIDPVYFGRTTCILSPKICHLGELTLVLELGRQPFVCYGDNDSSELGSSIHLYHSSAIFHVGDASPDPCNIR